MASKTRKTRKVTRPERADIASVEALSPILKLPAIKAIGRIGEVADEPPLLAVSGATLAIGLIARDRRLARAGAGMLVAHFIAIGIKTLGKNNVDRSRPPGLIKHGRYTMKPGHSRDKSMRSFPSGHTAGAVALARAVVREYPERAGAAYGVAATLGALQVMRRAHYPGDVLAGTLVGVASEAVAHGLLKPIEKAADLIMSQRNGSYCSIADRLGPHELV